MTLLDSASLLAAWERGREEPALARALTLLAAGTGRPVDEAAALDLGSRDALLAALLARVAGGTAWTMTKSASCD